MRLIPHAALALVPLCRETAGAMNDILIISGATPVPDASHPVSAEVGTSVDEAQELRAIEAESIGWWPLGGDAYLHVAERPGTDVTVISIVGVPQDAQEGAMTLLLM